MNFTKGEWKVPNIQERYGIPTKQYCEVWVNDLIVAICPFQSPIPNSERKANAHLIAAAPDMYEALKAIYNYTQFNEGIAKALAKAEGREE